MPQQVVDGFAGGGGVDLTGTGDLGQRILASVPPAQQPQIAPLIPFEGHGEAARRDLAPTGPR